MKKKDRIDLKQSLQGDRKRTKEFPEERTNPKELEGMYKEVERQMTSD